MEGKVSFKREMKHNYLMIEGDSSLESQYEVRMMISNVIEGLLRFRTKKVDSTCYFCYEITSRQPLSRLLEQKNIKAYEIRQMMMDILRTLNVMEEYLLKEEQIILEPEYIYIEPDSYGAALCLLPGRCEDFPKAMSKLLEYLLSHVDYQDQNAVVMGYGLYRESLKENYGMDDLLVLIAKEIGEANDKKEFKIKKETYVEPKSVEKPPDTYTEKIQAKKVKPIFPSLIKSLFLIIVSLILLWMLKGERGLWSYGIFLGLGELVLMIIFWILRRQSSLEKKEKSEHRSSIESVEISLPKEEIMPWNMVFEESENNNTMLLLDTEENKAIRRLTSIQGDVPDISISYYPFIIGKQENLVDYIFNKDTISRLHLRIDDLDGIYRMTDLNSTNGTSINGRVLETNENVELKVGDEIGIANFLFRFT